MIFLIVSNFNKQCFQIVYVNLSVSLLYMVFAELFSYGLHLQVLKETLVRHGFTFESETDTEVIPKLAKFVFDKANEEGDLNL